MAPTKEYKMKMCLLGEPAVGKTSLVNRFVINKFDDKYISTLGTKVSKKNVSVDINGEEVNVVLMIWDVLGQSQFKKVLQSALMNSRGALVVCDITRRETFERLEDWIKRAYATAGEIPIVILANKSDLKDKYAITEEELKEFAAKYNAPAFITSAKTGDHVEEAFKILAREMVIAALGLKKITVPVETEEGETEFEERFESIFDLEDKIISIFCDAMGGQDFAMPIVRQQFKRIGMDFRDPNIDGLKKLVENLAKILTSFKSAEEAYKIKNEMLNLITKFENSNEKS